MSTENALTSPSSTFSASLPFEVPSFSPYPEKQPHFDSFFSDSSIAALQGSSNERPLNQQHQQQHSQLLLHNLLSPTSPAHNPLYATSSLGNADFDQAFADLISGTTATSTTISLATPLSSFPPSNSVAFGGSGNNCGGNSSSSSTPVGLQKKPPRLHIPQPEKLAVAKPVDLPVAILSHHHLLVQQCEGENVAGVAVAVAAAAAAAEDRQWYTVFADARFPVDVSICSKTRCEEPSSEIPDKLYSSLKYEIRQQASGAACAHVPFLLGRITVVDAVQFTEILKDNKSVLKGTVEGSLVKPPTSQYTTLEGSLKVQFTDVSYHHKKKGFALQISYFAPSDLVHPVLIKRSASFLVFARKPNQNKKRKRTEPSENFALFQSRLDDIVQCSKKLKPQEKHSALQLLSNKLLEMDPAFFIDQLSRMQN